MIHKFCDECIADRVDKGFARPLSKVNGPNNTRYEDGKCEQCQKERQITAHPDIKPIKK
jgi:hypothetical protein